MVYHFHITIIILRNGNDEDEEEEKTTSRKRIILFDNNLTAFKWCLVSFSVLKTKQEEKKILVLTG